MIGTVAFDGASEGQPWVDIAPDIQDFFTSIGFSLGTALELTFTIGMLIGLGLVALIYLLGIAGSGPSTGARSVRSRAPTCTPWCRSRRCT